MERFFAYDDEMQRTICEEFYYDKARREILKHLKKFYTKGQWLQIALNYGHKNIDDFDNEFLTSEYYDKDFRILFFKKEYPD